MTCKECGTHLSVILHTHKHLGYCNYLCERAHRAKTKHSQVGYTRGQ